MTQEKRLRTIDGATLMSCPIQPLNFVVDTLLSQGLHILAGSPKVGKSWLALWLAVAVAKGEPVWGMPVKQGTTLYLCLEDSTLRIQNRLLDITKDAPSTVHFCTEAALLGRGLEGQLEGFLMEHPDTSLVIIDTLQMIRGTTYDSCLGKQVVVIDGLKEVLKELKSIGRNLNQLVTLAHMGRVTVVNLEGVYRSFSELCGTVRIILERKRW